jgi:hypothetical protein
MDGSDVILIFDTFSFLVEVVLFVVASAPSNAVVVAVEFKEIEEFNKSKRFELLGWIGK